MDNGIGFSYQPGQTGQAGAQSRTGARGPQEAVRLLNLRVPRVVGANAPIPGPLLNATGGGPTDLNVLLKALMASFGGGGKQIVGDGPQATDMGMGQGPIRAPQMGQIGPPRLTPGDTPADGGGRPDITATGPGGFGREVLPLF